MALFTTHEPDTDLLPGLSVGSRVDAPVLPDQPDFHCPHCQAHTPFNLYFAQAESLAPQVRAAFDKATRSIRYRNIAHQDFHCRGCARAVRVAYGAIEFAMSSYVYCPQKVFIGPPRE